MKAHSAETQATITPQKALKFLKEGNKRFINNLSLNRNLSQQMSETKNGQWPFAVILSCIDSRTSAELIFDQGLGDIFSVRIAGNAVNEDVLGSMEFACKVSGSKLIVVLGHTKCGAIKGACDGVELGNLTGLLHKIKPAIEKETSVQKNRTSSNLKYIEKIAKLNVLHAVEEIRQKSPLLKQMEDEGLITVCGAMYNVESGKVIFYNN